MKIEVLSEAEDDLARGFYFYEAQQDGLGDYFADSLLADIESLQIHAGIHIQYCGFYRLLARRFPFAVYYKKQEDLVQVYAVLDCRGNPEKALQLLDELDARGL